MTQTVASRTNGDGYWAAYDKDELGDELMSRVAKVYDHITSTGLYGLRQRSYCAYYGLDDNSSTHTASSVFFGGAQGELTLYKVNHFRNLLLHILNYATQNRPALEARAINSDYASLAQATLANGILDYYLHAKGVESRFVEACEYGVTLSEGFMAVTWDTSLGDPIRPVQDPTTGQTTMKTNGDVRVDVLGPLDVIKDPYRRFDDTDWVITRRFVNRYDLVARYPELEDEILAAEKRDVDPSSFPVLGMQRADSDDVALFEFYHRRTPALPQGRHTAFVSDDAILFDGPIPYEELPVYRLAPGEILGTSYGYTVAFDLLAMQQAVDAMHSSALSSLQAFGVQNIVVEDGINVGLEQLTGGLNLLKVPRASMDGIRPLMLAAIPGEVFKFLDTQVSSMESISGVNSTARGNVDAKLSGTAYAFLESRTLQFMSALQRSYTKLLEDVGTAIVRLLQNPSFAGTERTAEIVGKDERYMTKTYTAQDLSKVKRVIVDVSNPLMRTTSGRIQVADTLLERGLINDTAGYLQMLRTGRSEPMFQRATTQRMQIKGENEMLAQGPPSVPTGELDPVTGQPLMTVQGVAALIDDDHPKHIAEHSLVTSNPESREDPEAIRATGDHNAEHIRLWKAMPPALLAALGMQPPPPDMPPPGMEGGPPQPGGPGPAAIGPGGPPQQGQQMSEAAQEAGAAPAGMPSMPKNPMTGERVQVPNGGMQ